MNAAKVKQLFTYPIKGLSPHPCDRVELEIDRGIRGDRAFALMFVDDPTSEPADIVPWMSKGHFAVQNDWPVLAALQCVCNGESLTVKRQGETVLAAPTTNQEGRDRIAAFFTDYLADAQPTPEARHPKRSPLHLVGSSTGETRYPDRAPVHISLLSQATLDALSEAIGDRVEVERFRPNILLEGVPAWEEFSWVGKAFNLGEAKIEITARIGRCPNIEVNSQTGDRDLALLSLLQEKYGHRQTGVLAKIRGNGAVAIGDMLRQ